VLLVDVLTGLGGASQVDQQPAFFDSVDEKALQYAGGAFLLLADGREQDETSCGLELVEQILFAR
jgi:hypothetical protein